MCYGIQMVNVSLISLDIIEISHEYKLPTVSEQSHWKPSGGGARSITFGLRWEELASLVPMITLRPEQPHSPSFPQDTEVGVPA